ncbi:MAG: DUF2189 domain-containing protein [Alphaproteobacteria bacterium]|nr:MAG: DUF2189 domain-containing protein [Alphaproteobacteria bacterium]
MSGQDLHIEDTPGWHAKDMADEGSSVPEVARITSLDLKEALRRGFDDFLARPTHLIFLGAIYPIISILLFFWISGRNLWPLVWPLVAGFTLVGPLAAIGLYEISRRRERGETVSWRHAISVLDRHRLWPLSVVALVLSAIFFAWVASAHALYVAFFGPPYGVTIDELVRQIFQTPQGWKLIFWGNLIGLGYAILSIMVSLVSLPLIVDGEQDAVRAIIVSVRAALKNPMPVAIWGLIVAGTVFLGALTGFLALAVLFPILGHATWHLYRRLVACEGMTAGS